MVSIRSHSYKTQLKVKSIRSVEAAISLLDELAESRNGKTLSEIARGLKLPKSSIHAIVVTLERGGYLHRDFQNGRYSFGVKLLHLARAALPNLQIRWLSAPLLQQLAKVTGLTVNLAVLDMSEVVFVEKITPPGCMSPPTWIGKHMDLNCTAVGKVLVAGLSNQEIDRLILHHGMPKHNENASVSPNRFKQELQKVRTLGYAFNDEENEIGYRAIAVPIPTPETYGAVAISVAGRVSEIHERNFDDLVRRLKIIARQVATELETESLISGNVLAKHTESGQAAPARGASALAEPIPNASRASARRNHFSTNTIGYYDQR